MNRRQMGYHQRVLIVGAGRAGVAAAEELRRLSFDGEIVVLSDEVDPPYDRPACSKGLLTGKARPVDVRLSLDQCVDVQWRPGQRAVLLDTEAQEVETDSGEVYEYDGLVIASGSHMISPKDWPIGEPGLHLLHRLSDAWALRHDLRHAERVAIVGGGLTGCETACAVRNLARDCVLIDSNKQVMTRALGEYMGALVTEEIAKDGVEMRMGRRVKDLFRHKRGWRLVLDDASYVDADVVVMTVGERPDVEWISSAPEIDISDGVLCDESLRVVGTDNVVAAGAVARWPNLRYGTTPRRCGQWIAALEHGKAAARALLAGPDVDLPPVTLLPRFWTDQYGLRIQVCGDLPRDADLMVTEMRPGRKDTARAGLLVSYVKDSQVVGLVACNAPQAFTSVTRSMLIAPQQAALIGSATRTASDTSQRRLAKVS